MQQARWIRMLVLLFPWLYCFIAMAIQSCGAQLKTGDDLASIVTVDVQSVTLVDVSRDKIQFNLILGIISKRTLSIREVAFSKLRINELPVYAAPFTEPLNLKAGQAAVSKLPLMLTLYYRDLDSLKPVQNLVSDGHAVIKGTAYVELDMAPLAKLILLTRHVRVPVPFDHAISLEIPGGPLVRNSALKLLEVSQSAVDKMGGQLQAATKLLSEWRRQLWEEYAPLLVLGRATYEIVDKSGKVATAESTAVGFRIEGKKLIVPKELIEPWKFDVNMAASLKQDANLRVSNYELWIWPAYAKISDSSGELDSTTAWRLSQNQLKLLGVPQDDDEIVLVPDPGGRLVKVAVHRRDTPTNVAMVEIIDVLVKPEQPKLEKTPPDTAWDAVAVFRFPDGIRGQAQPDLVIISATRQGSRIIFGTPLDSSAWGGPLILQQGIVGMVQSESSGVTLRDAGQQIGATVGHARTSANEFDGIVLRHY